MRGRRRERARAKADAEAQAQAAMMLAAQHADAGRRAQEAGSIYTWEPPGAPPVPPGAPLGTGGWAAAAPPTSPASAPPPVAEPAPVAEAAPVPAPAPLPQPTPTFATHSEVLRVLEVVTRMCEHVIEYLESERDERRMIVEALAQVSKTIAASQPVIDLEDHQPEPQRERIIGGSMDAGPEPDIDLREPEPLVAVPVEVRCRFGEGDRWVAGFEVVDVTGTTDDPRYRLRRQRDGAVLPELFDAANVRRASGLDGITAPADRRWTKL